MGRIELRTFDGDLEALAAMAYETLFEEYGDNAWRDLNRPEVARLVLADVPDPRFLVGAYDGDKLVAFVANLPRRYRLNGQTYTGVYATMLAARKGYQAAVAMLMAECLRRNLEFQADFVLFTVQKGTRAARLLVQVLGSSYRIERLKAMHAIARGIDLGAIAASQHLSWYVQAAGRLLGAHRPIAAPAVPGIVRPYREADLDAILDLTRRYSDRGRLVRVFGQEALSHRLHTAGLTWTLVYEHEGAVRACVTATGYDLVSARGRQRWAWLDLVLWTGLAAGEKRALLAGLWQSSRDQGCIGILEWNKGYYALGPLFLARFVPYFNCIEMYAWILNPALSLCGIRGVLEEIA